VSDEAMAIPRRVGRDSTFVAMMAPRPIAA
jgi:hypothetical protein